MEREASVGKVLIPPTPGQKKFRKNGKDVSSFGLLPEKFSRSTNRQTDSGRGEFVLPIILNPNGRTVVIIGGGMVGKRKAAACAEAGFAVRVVDPVVEPWPGVAWIAEPYRAEHLSGASLAVAAATADVNAAVVADARRAGLLVCDAANPSAGDFAFPAVVRRGLLTVAVSTGGASPALSATIRDELAARFGPEYAMWLELLAEARRAVLDRVPDAGARRRLLTDFASGEWLDRLRTVGPDAVRAELRAEIEAAARSEPEA